MKKWTVKYENSQIRVENRASDERLYINGRLHDMGKGISSRSKLIGRTPDGKLVKVSLGGNLRIHCMIFVEDELILDD